MSTQVKAFLPIDITDDRLVSSSIPEPDEGETPWDELTSFGLEAVTSVIAANTHLLYGSAAAGNLNHPPATSPDWWVKKSYTNRYRMFDWYRNKPSIGKSPLSVVIRPKTRINAIVLEGLKANLLEIIVRNGIDGPIVYTLHADLLARHVTTPYEYCFAPFIFDKVVSTFNIPPVADPVIAVTVEDPSGTCEMGRFGTGMTVDIGDVDWQTVIEDENYSEMDWDKYGTATLTPIPSLKGLEMVTEIDAVQSNVVRQFKQISEARPVFWSAMHNIEAYKEMHTLIGVHERFKVVTKNHRTAEIDLKLRGI